ncbi:MAG: threonylcarbamoyl-AMP synthase [Dethiosulfovibrio peptidovorans]|nr:MAG: threonylcarbamoyl-AMP synthase [Dethiosulfovibrio peptidovorans]
MIISTVDRWNPDETVIHRASQILGSGGLVAFPTETVYGLGANGLDGSAVSSIFRAKGRPSDNPLILHVGLPDAVSLVAEVNRRARVVMDTLWPGPLTLVLPARPSVPSEVTAGLFTVAVRMPSHPVALALLQDCSFPVAAPSANSSGRPSPTDADAVLTDLGQSVDLIVDGGSTDLGVESTVLDMTGQLPVLLRPGGMPLELLRDVVGQVLLPQGAMELRRSPGTRYRHYAPVVPLLLWIPDEPFPAREGIGAYMGMVPPPVVVFRSLVFDSVSAYARGLFAAMRDLEREPVEFIVAQLPSFEGIGYAVRDRLCRAAGSAVCSKKEG